MLRPVSYTHLDRPEENVMENPPVSSNKSLFSGGLGYRIAYEGFMIGILALTAFGIGHKYFDNGEIHNISRKMAFAVLSISQLVHAFNMRTDKSIFKIHIFGNKYLCIAFIIGVAMQAAVKMCIRDSYYGIGVFVFSHDMKRIFGIHFVQSCTSYYMEKLKLNTVSSGICGK